MSIFPRASVTVEVGDVSPMELVDYYYERVAEYERQHEKIGNHARAEGSSAYHHGRLP